MTSTVVRPAEGSAFAFDRQRLAIGLVLIGAGVAITWFQADVRVLEAAASRPILAVVMGRAVHLPGSDSVYYPDYDGNGFRAMTVTASCSSALVVGPMLAAGGLLALLRRIAPWRAALAMLAAASCLVVVNFFRIACIAVATREFGRNGYLVAHRGVGSAMVLFSVAASLVVAYRVVASDSPPARS